MIDITSATPNPADRDPLRKLYPIGSLSISYNNLHACVYMYTLSGGVCDHLTRRAFSGYGRTQAPSRFVFLAPRLRSKSSTEVLRCVFLTKLAGYMAQ